MIRTTHPRCTARREHAAMFLQRLQIRLMQGTARAPLEKLLDSP